MTAPVVEITNLGKRYPLQKEASTGFWRDGLRSLAAAATGRRLDSAAAPKEIWALKDVSFSINKGERVGIIGKNGAGKSTLLKILSRVVAPTVGEARIRGRLTSLLEVGTGFNDNLTGRENVYLNAALHGLSKAEIDDRYADIVIFSEMEKFMETAVKKYSSGMKMRLAFSVAAHLEPDILLLDEVLAVGDISFQRKCLERVEGMTSDGQTLMFVSHSMDSIVRYCDRCVWLDQGEMRMSGEAQEVTTAYVESVLGLNANLQISREEPKVTVQAAENATSETAEASPSVPAVSSAPALSGHIGDENARLVRASVIDEKGTPSSLLKTSEKIGIRFSYEVLQSGVYLPAVGIFSAGIQVLQTAPADPEIAAYQLAPGVYESTVWLPAQFLNVGVYSVTLGLADPRTTPMTRYFKAEMALSFHTVDPPLMQGSVRGIVPSKFPGVVRPRLEWQRMESAATTAAKSENR